MLTGEASRQACSFGGVGGDGGGKKGVLFKNSF